MIRSLASGLYGGVVEARRKLYSAGLVPVRRASVPVVCVGNLSVGGTGKTPMVEFLARMMPAWGLWPGIVSRGYKRSTPPDQFVLVSDGQEIYATAAEGGDEPVLLANMLRGVAVGVCADRVRACTELTDAGLCDSIILDDGFQHLRLHRDCDIVLVDATVDLSRTRMLPFGTRREPLSALRRATCVVHTKVPHPGAIAPKNDFYRQNRAKVSKIAPWVPQFATRFLPESLVRIGAAETSTADDIDLGDLPGLRVLAFAGIARPETFFDTLRGLGCEVIEKPFSDHQSYDYREIAQLLDDAVEQDVEAIITTAKDAVKLLDMKLPDTPPIYMLTQTVQMDEQDAFRELLTDTLRHAMPVTA
jgi:tetraacyldisaccharide 4'-kinase